MISKLSLSAAVVAAAALAVALPAMSAPISVSPLKNISSTQSGMVEQVHGWHRKCWQGLNGRHRHVKGVGRVQCYCSKRDWLGNCLQWR